MITLSQFVVIGILEVLAILVLALGALLVYNHRLHRRGTSLATQLTQLKDTTRFLLTKVNELRENTYASFLSNEIDSAREQVVEFIIDDELHFLSNQEAPDKANIMRYLMLQAELAAEDETIDEEEKQARRAGRLTEIVSDFERAAVSKNEETDTPPSDDGEIDTADLKQKWGYLVDAALALVQQRTFQSEEDLLDIVQVINTDLKLDAIQLPELGTVKSANSETVAKIKGDGDRSREVITKLLAERNAAEEQISIKAEELEKIQRYLKESEVCLELVETELRDTQKELQLCKAASEHDPVEMQNLIQRFTNESSEMLLCIETLESENSDLKSQLGLT